MCRYKLKNENELVSLLEGRDNFFVVSCNACFSVFDNGDDGAPTVKDEFFDLLKTLGKTVSGCADIDFLCNKRLTGETLVDVLPPGVSNIFVLSCGLGVQTIRALMPPGISVFAVCDTLPEDGANRGMALTDFRCNACGQCFLNETGGICPIYECSKSLLNGQCGGAKGGKCEVDRDKECAWERIYKRQTTKDEETTPSLRATPPRRGIIPPKIRDYSKVSGKKIRQYVDAIRSKRFEGFYGGVYPDDWKNFSENLPLIPFPGSRAALDAPDIFTIPLKQHAGAPALPLVSTGGTVKVGQKIGGADGSFSSNIHSSVSGIVLAVEPCPHSYKNEKILSVIIKSDGKNELHDSIIPADNPKKLLQNLTPEQIIESIREKGVVGMGGAAFPTPLKMDFGKNTNPQAAEDSQLTSERQTIIINGCECEPLLTVDHRVMLDYADEVVFGTKAVLKATGAAKAIIAIEDNKPDAIAHMQSKTVSLPNIEVMAVKVKYPQGSEKMLIKRVLGKTVPPGGLPKDIGALVFNVCTMKAVSDALRLGKPLIERPLSVSGAMIREPGNFLVKIGTPIRDVINFCGIKTDGNVVIIHGGPMMGFEIKNLDAPVTKGMNGIIAIKRDCFDSTECIKCGRCADVCPMKLMPLYFSKYADKQELNEQEKNALNECIECGCCDYVCPAKIRITDAVRALRGEIRG